MSPPPVTIDDAGLRLPVQTEDSCDVFFDGAHVWSFSVSERGSQRDDEVFVPWPKAMRSWLNGATKVSVTAGGGEIYSKELRFGEGPERIRFVDKDGIPVMIDKWGLIQRPFAGRGSGVIAHMVEMTERILEALEQECGIKAWIAFGTLLGAARSGKVIGHDSDIDLAYLSNRPTPAAMAREMFEISRALRRRGMNVLNKSGSFVTVMFSAPDGGQASIDIYTAFYVGDVLYETATVRARVPRTAIEPLTTIEFEGRMLPAPADPDVMLAASYGPDWRVPDPSFAHRPGPEVKRRFDPWFGSLMRHRRDWERSYRGRSRLDWSGSDFARWAAERLEPGRPVIDVGAGPGSDSLVFAAAGWEVSGLDYARGAMTPATRRAAARELPATFVQMNLYDLRDALTQAALLARTTKWPRAVYARALVDSLEADGLSNFWRFSDMVLRGHGSLYLEFGGEPGEPGRTTGGGRRHRLDPSSVARQATAAGGRVVEVEQVPTEAAPLWRMALEWTR